MTNLRHEPTASGYACPITGKTTDRVWTDHSKPGNGNSCPHCTGEMRSIGQMLHALNEEAGREHRARRAKRK